MLVQNKKVPKETLELLDSKIEEFEKNTNSTVLYITITGSVLYGTDNENSDLDFKGIFMPNLKEVLIGNTPSAFVFNSNTKDKNSSDDIDLTLHPVNDFFNHLRKSETGAVDLLFSMFREDTIVFDDGIFTNFMKKNYQKFRNSNMKSFIGYAVGQTKKFGIKGARYEELDVFYKDCVNYFNLAPKENKLGEYWDFLELKAQGKKYIKFTKAEGARRNDGSSNIIDYISVLGKLYHKDVTVGYFLERVSKFYNQFGNRTKTVAKTESKTDWKAMSHALRVAMEVKELLQFGFIKFPLTYADEIKEVKFGNREEQETLDKIRDVLGEVDTILENIDKDNFPCEMSEELLKKLKWEVILLYKEFLDLGF